MDKYITYNSTSELHKGLTNILLLCIEDASTYDWYCYCGEEFGDCDLYNLIVFLYDPEDKCKMDGVSPKKFLQYNYNNRSKLEKFSMKILPFFDAMKKNHPKSLEFFEREYWWTSRDYSSGEFSLLTLKEVIESEIEFVERNPHEYNVNE